MTKWLLQCTLGLTFIQIFLKFEIFATKIVRRRASRTQESITKHRTVAVVLDARQSFADLFALKFLLVNP